MDIINPGTIKAPSISAVGVRQTVLNGSVDANGFPNALSIGTGLAVTLTATVRPFRLSFAADWDGYGQIDLSVSFTTNQSFAALTASTTCFLYVDCDSSGNLATGFSLLAPVYSTVAPASPATDQHWFSLSTFTMQRWSGSAWTTLQRVFVGECVTSASTVSSSTTYAYRGFYQSAWLAVVANTTYNFAPNLGSAPAAANANFGIWTSTTGLDSGAILATPAFNSGGIGYGYSILNPSGTIRNNFRLTTQAYVALDASNAWATTGYYSLRGTRGF